MSNNVSQTKGEEQKIYRTEQHENTVYTMRHKFTTAALSIPANPTVPTNNIPWNFDASWENMAGYDLAEYTASIKNSDQVPRTVFTAWRFCKIMKLGYTLKTWHVDQAGRQTVVPCYYWLDQNGLLCNKNSFEVGKLFPYQGSTNLDSLNSTSTWAIRNRPEGVAYTSVYHVEAAPDIDGKYQLDTQGLLQHATAGQLQPGDGNGGISAQVMAIFNPMMTNHAAYINIFTNDKVQKDPVVELQASVGSMTNSLQCYPPNQNIQNAMSTPYSQAKLPVIAHGSWLNTYFCPSVYADGHYYLEVNAFIEWSLFERAYSTQMINPLSLPPPSLKQLALWKSEAEAKRKNDIIDHEEKLAKKVKNYLDTGFVSLNPVN
jgi:hypothetical protein